jgi:putative membrane protein
MTDSDTRQEHVAAPRVILGGVFMGLANLVPGVSGGTMILAMGLYDRFIEALADVTRLRLRREALVFLALIAFGALMALIALSGLAVTLVSEHRWVMYSLFIGMTLGGTPELWKACKPVSSGSFLAFSLALALMGTLAWGLQGAQIPETTITFVFMGVLGASSMILPGISGSYMLLIFGMYDVVVGSLSSSALKESPLESVKVLVPVAIGAALGMALLSNLLKHLLEKRPVSSHSVLLGLLLGSVLGLWPFQTSVNPDLAQRTFRKSVVMLVAGEDLAVVNAKYGLQIEAERAQQLRGTYEGLGAGELKQLGDELERFDPSGKQVAISIGLLLAGFGLTRMLGRRPSSNACSAVTRNR